MSTLVDALSPLVDALVFGRTVTPVLFMHELFLGPSAGGIGLKSSAFAPAWFSEFRYQKRKRRA